jgi:biofilm PGA synthesis protein PgaD
MKPEDLIIDRPEWLSQGQRYTTMGATLFFWFVLLYLWQPAISLVAWAFNIKLFYSHMVVLGGYEIFLDVWMRYLTIIALLGATLIGWAKINEYRFKNVERRTGLGATDDDSIANTFGVSPAQLQQWRTMKNMQVSIDPASQIKSVNIHTPPEMQLTPDES